MPNVMANGIQIEYDTFGDSSFPALLLVAGNGAQLIFWDRQRRHEQAWDIARDKMVIKTESRGTGFISTNNPTAIVVLLDIITKRFWMRWDSY